jgi:hypothetical protein
VIFINYGELEAADCWRSNTELDRINFACDWQIEMLPSQPFFPEDLRKILILTCRFQELLMALNAVHDFIWQV